MLRVEGVNRGVVERFIAPVLKTGEPLRVPGVRIPPPLQTKAKSRESGIFCWREFEPSLT